MSWDAGPDTSPAILIPRIISFSYSAEPKYEILSFLCKVSLSLERVKVLLAARPVCSILDGVLHVNEVTFTNTHDLL